MSNRFRLTHVVPTAGRSPYLQDCLRALAAAEAGPILVATDRLATLPDDLDLGRAQRLEIPGGAGFAVACNRALRVTESDFVALVNDDAVIGAGWTDTLLSVLEDEADLAAVQGTNLRLADPEIVDGCGIAWNRHWQAVQLGSGDHRGGNRSISEIFGASGTAAILRRSALDAVALEPGRYFDPRLGSYYEDVELAGRLRSRGFRALHVPAASARHAGSASSANRRIWRWSQIYGNRLLVLARLWGRSFPLRMPALLARDSVDLIGAILSLDIPRSLGIVRGWGRALRYLGHFAHLAPATPSLTDLRRFQEVDPRE